MDKNRYSEFVKILKEELVPALGCTEPIAIAYTSSIASSLLSSLPEKLDVYVSSNIIKNVKSVIVPNTKGGRGIKTAAAAGVISKRPEKRLEVLSSLTDDEIAEIEDYIEKSEINVLPSPRDYIFSIIVEAYSKGEKAKAEIAGDHTNVILVKKNDEVIYEREYEEKKVSKANRDLLTIESIVDFAAELDIEDVRETIERQIKFNMAIAEDALTHSYGANIGRILLSSYGESVNNRAKAYAAAASDARMSGSEKPVIINSGSGNQGITVSVPVIVYARDNAADEDLLIRSLVVSNLVAIHIKSSIGALSAYCGATSAACGASAGISYLYGGRVNEISHAVVNSLAIESGMICDGAKPSCAAKIASAVEAGLLGFEMTRNSSQFLSGDGIVTKGVENTIRNIVELATVGMRETDRTIINIMTGK